jgi:hypothetical protein
MMAAGSEHVMRFNDWNKVNYLSPSLYHVSAFQELKTTWHAVESGNSGGQGY